MSVSLAKFQQKGMGMELAAYLLFGTYNYRMSKSIIGIGSVASQLLLTGERLFIIIIVVVVVILSVVVS